MSAITFFTSFYNELLIGSHDLNTHTIKVALTNTLPVASQTVFDPITNHPPPAAANGYTTGGHDTQNVCSGGIMTCTDVVITATAGGIGPFRYEVLYNSSSGDKLVGWIDKGASVTLASGDTETVDFNPAGVIKLP